MTHSHPHQMFMAHVMEPDGNVVDCIIGSEKGAPMEEVRARFEQFLEDTQEPGHVVLAFHELEPEPNPMPRIEWPSALVAMIMQGLGAVAMILLLVRYLYRKFN